MKFYLNALAVLLCSCQEVLAQHATISIVHINDVYQISAQGTQSSGLPRIPALLNRLGKSPAPVLSFGGDTLSPSIASSEFKGKQMVAAWNALNVDVAVLGNHEFDFGPEILKERIRESRFPWLAANVVKRGTGEIFPGSRAYVIKEIDGIRLAFVGVITEDTARISKAGPDYEFLDAVDMLCREANRLRKEDAVDLIIGLTHLDLESDRKVAKRCSVDMILGGHDHHLVSEVVAGRPIFKAGADAKDAVVTHLTVDRGTRKLERIEWQIVPLDKSLPDDPKIVALANEYEVALQEKLTSVVGNTSTSLDARTVTVRMRESRAGYLVADAFRDAMGAEIALVNGGSLRSDVLIGPGAITKLDIKKMLPFENHVFKIEITGKKLVAVLENISDKLGMVPLGRFPHVSGMKVVFDKSKPAGHRVVKVTVGDKLIVPDRTYTLAVSEYLAGGSDSYEPLRGAKQLMPEDLSPIETEVVIDFITRQKATLRYRDEHRVTIK